MCLAIAPSTQSDRRYGSRLWRHISGTPSRLLPLTAALHLVAGFLIHALGNLGERNLEFGLFGLVYGVLALFVFGSALTTLPSRVGVSPLHNARYGGINLLIFSALLVLEVGLFRGGLWPVIGALLMLSGWSLTMFSLRQLHQWASGESRFWSGMLVSVATAGCAGIVVFLFGTWLDIPVMILISLFIGLIVGMLSFMAAMVLVYRLPAQGRKVLV